MTSAYANINKIDYRAAWAELEQVELACADLTRNPFLDLELFKVVELGKSVRRWQSLFPYRLFASPEMIIRQERCTICKEIRSPFSACDHQLGRVYCGIMCSAEVVDFEFRGISIVTDPVQKFSVLIPEPDPFNYDPVRFVADRVSGPFAYWTSSTQLAYHDHALFKAWPVNGVCPCESGRFYEDCCFLLPGVRLPHTSIFFDEPLPDDLLASMVSVRPPRDTIK